MRLAIQIYLIIALALHASLGSMVVAQKLHSINAALDDDVLVICTGTQLKYIDASHYYNTGHIVEISSPTDSPNDKETSAKFCIVCQAQEVQPSLLVPLAKLLTSQFTISSEHIFSHISAFVLQRFILPILRAPPVLMTV